MVAGWAVFFSALVYLCLLFAVAHWGDNAGRRFVQGPARSTISALALAVYCTSWTFFGSVGLASRSGFDFLTIYIGPILVIGLGHVLVARVVRVAKTQNISSIADFVAARYGKSERVAAIVSLIALDRLDPLYRAAAEGRLVLARCLPGRSRRRRSRPDFPFFGDLALIVALVLAGFAVAFGTRHTDATEHQDGLMMAISIESVVKLVAFLIVGGYVTFVMFDGYDAIVEQLSTPQASSAEPARAHLGLRQLHHPHPAVELRRAAAAAPVPHDGRREPRHRGREARRLAVSALPRAHQPLRHSRSRSAGLPIFPERHHRPRHDGAGAAARRRGGRRSPSSPSSAASRPRPPW